MLKKLLQKEFIRFGIVGVIATIIQYVMYLLFLQITNVTVSFTASYIVSFIANFYLTAYFTFGTGPSWKKLAGMCGAHAVNFTLQYLLNILFIEIVSVPKELSLIPTLIFSVPINFLLVRFVFKKKKQAEDATFEHTDKAE